MIRRARPEDAAAVAEIARAAYAVYRDRTDRDPAPMGEDYEALVGEGVVDVAILDGEVAGYVVVRIEGDEALLENLAVDPARQGSGLGRALVDHAEEVSRDQGCRSIRLYTHEVMTENQRLYEHLRYAETLRAVEDGFRRV